MRGAALLLIAASGVVTPEQRYFRLQRPVTQAPSAPRQTCVALDRTVFAHAAPGLADLRLYQGGTETPFVVRIADPVHTAEVELITPTNLGTRAGQTAFDAVMPPGSYSDLELNLDGQDFLATVTVTGSQTQTGSSETRLGAFTIFDLSRQRLGRSTVLHLPQTDFRFLHLTLGDSVKPEQVRGLSVVQQPTSEQRYVLSAVPSPPSQKGRFSVAEFDLPAHVPVDRVAFSVGTEPAQFSRSVEIIVRQTGTRTPVTDTGAAPPEPARFSGSLLRIHRKQDGQQIDEERLAVNVSGQSFARPTRWTVRVENGDDRALSLQSVRLEMEQRDLCFEATRDTTPYVLLYGDPVLRTPTYDYASLFVLQKDAARGVLGAEAPHPGFTPRPDSRPFTERHPALLWIALLAAVGLLGGVALRSGVRTGSSA